MSINPFAGEKARNTKNKKKLLRRLKIVLQQKVIILGEENGINLNSSSPHPYQIFSTFPVKTFFFFFIIAERRRKHKKIAVDRVNRVNLHPYTFVLDNILYDARSFSLLFIGFFFFFVYIMIIIFHTYAVSQAPYKLFYISVVRIT